MNKKDYIDAMNEIEIDEKIRKETINKMKENKKGRIIRKLYPLASLAVVCVIIMAFVLPHKTVAPGANIEPVITSMDDVKEQGRLPRVGNFENMYAILRERADDYSYYNRYYMTDDVAINEAQSIKGDTADTSEKNTDYSQTNVQVEGVDEADIVKTDGRYIYFLANDELIIADTNDNGKLVSASKIDFDNDNEFYPSELYLVDDKLVIIGTTRHERILKNMSRKYYYSSYDTYTTARVYNIKDKTSPKQERKVDIEGSYVSSRMINSNLYLIANQYNENAWLCRENDLDELKENEFKPKFRDTVTEGGRQYIDFDCIYYIPETEDTSFLNIAAFDVNKNEAANIESYIGAGSQIYASTNNLYVTKTLYDYDKYYTDSTSDTEILKFELKDNKCEFVTTSTVPGTIVNQFSMDEKDGYFRIATTKGGWNSSKNSNSLYVLDEDLVMVGKVDGLAKGEKIYSVRFMGDRAYIVTFVQTDPLFVIDLKDPKKPTVLGELKIPGYSKYLHPYDETHIIGFGEDTEIENYGYGDVVRTNGMKMALFDVSDPTSPKELYSEKIGGKGTYSELLYNHKALLFSKEKNIIAFPISITSDDYKVTFQGAIVYGLSLDGGFELKGKISNAENDLDRYYYSNSVKRIIYIKDNLYTISNDLIKATDMNTMETKGTLTIK